MSRKTTQFRRKIAQLSRTRTDDCKSMLIPSERVKSAGRATIHGQIDTLDEDGRPQRAGKRYPGKATGAIGTEPMKPEKAQRLLKLK